MKDEKKVKATEEVKEDAKTEEEGVQLTDEEMSSVAGGYMKVQVEPSFPPYNG